MACKISIIGGGAVGSTLAQRVVESAMADVVLLDILGNVARGKAFDMMDASSIVAHERNVLGTSDYGDIKSSDIVVVTAGLPRKPGMTREDLVSKNADIVKNVSANIKKYAPGSIVIIVTNPLDVMTYLAYKVTGFDRNKVFGMAGVLDGSRLIYLLAEAAKVPRSSVRTYVMGSHGDTMVPVISKTTISGKPVTSVLSMDVIDKIVKRTRDRGAEIVSLLGAGSAYYSPSAAVFKMIKAILEDAKDIMTVSSVLNGQYGLSDVAIGVPCVIGKGGIKDIIELDLTEDEAAYFRKSANAVKDSIGTL